MLLLLDTGIRLGELFGLQWSDINWGRDGDDTSRSVYVCRSLSRGKHLGPPKSGRNRWVKLSRRARHALREHWMAQGQPLPESLVMRRKSMQKFRATAWVKIQDEARLPGILLKDLRDTYASQLLTAGVPVASISHQLGHAKTGITEASYARWIPSDEERPQLVLPPGEVYADLLARLIPEPSSAQAGA